jgi:hypothetical protein
MKYEIGKEYILLNVSNGVFLIRTYAGISDSHNYSFDTVHKFVNSRVESSIDIFVSEGSTSKLILEKTPLMEALL